MTRESEKEHEEYLQLRSERVVEDPSIILTVQTVIEKDGCLVEDLFERVFGAIINGNKQLIQALIVDGIMIPIGVSECDYLEETLETFRCNDLRIETSKSYDQSEDNRDYRLISDKRHKMDNTRGIIHIDKAKLNSLLIFVYKYQDLLWKNLTWHKTPC